MGKKSGPTPAPAPKPTDPGNAISLDFLLGNVNTENPTQRTELGVYDDEGNWRSITQQERQQAFATAFKDPTKVNYAALAPLLAAERRSVEDPRLRAIRERDQEASSWRQQIGLGYMNQFGVAPTPLPQSQYGLPANAPATPPLSIPTGGSLPGLPGLGGNVAMPRPMTFKPPERKK